MRLQRRLRDLILNGELSPGERLPASRALAKVIGCARGTAESCYAELEAEGLISRRRGDGSYVSEALRHLPAREPVASGDGPWTPPRLSARGRRLAAMAPCPFPHSVVPFAGGLPELRAFPWALWRRLAASSLQADVSVLAGYGEAAGLLCLREALARWLRRYRGIHCDPSQLVILHSAQQALSLIASLLFDPGDRVALEDPGYPGAVAAFSAAGLKLRGLPVDREGLQVARLRRGQPPAGVYVTPSYQNPLGSLLSLERRLQLIEWAAASGSWIIEDDYGGGLAYDHRPIAALAGLGGGARRIYIGTASKLIFPGLRIAWMLLPPDLVQPFTSLRSNLDGHSASLSQMTLSRFIDEGHFAKHLRAMTTLYRERRARMLAELDQLQSDFPTIIQEVWPSNAGLKLAVTLVPPYRDEDLAAAAAQQGLELPRLSACSLSRDTAKQGILLGFSALNEAEMSSAFLRLKSVLQKL